MVYGNTVDIGNQNETPEVTDRQMSENENKTMESVHNAAKGQLAV